MHRQQRPHCRCKGNAVNFQPNQAAWYAEAEAHTHTQD
jgi:hypothetical protein